MDFVPSRKAIALLSFAIIAVSPAQAATPEQIVATLRLAGTVTGGLMPTTAPEFAQMVAAVERGDYYNAVLIAAQSAYGTKFMLRRLALQMQNQGYDAIADGDNASTAYLIAHFAGVGGVGAPSISKIWSNNVSCMVRRTNNTLVRADQLNANDLATIDWRTALECTPGHDAFPLCGADNAARVPIPEKHVGGFTTTSMANNDLSFAQNGFTAGTNLRFIYSYWAVATGMEIIEFADA